METWYEPDPIFSIFDKAKTREEFVQNWVVRGQFHSKVPEDILKSYKTVEYLMAHAWYHWPMFDEALRKLLGMVEMAVKKRCAALEIDLAFEYTDKCGKQKKGEKNFNRLIEDLSGKEPQKALKRWLHDVRWLRNHFSHPDGKTLMGGLVIGKIKNIVNLINLIFLDEVDCIAAKEKTTLFEREYADFKEGLFVLECTRGRILVTEMRLLEAFQVKDDWVYLCYFSPVLVNVLENLSERQYTLPPLIALSQIKLKEGVFEANDFETGSSVKVLPTAHPDNQKALNKHQQDWDQLDSTNQTFYKLHLDSACGGKLRDFMYQHRWTT